MKATGLIHRGCPETALMGLVLGASKTGRDTKTGPAYAPKWAKLNDFAVFLSLIAARFFSPETGERFRRKLVRTLSLGTGDGLIETRWQTPTPASLRH